MRGLAKISVAACLTMLVLAAPAQADFGLNDFDVTFTNQDGTQALQAGSHPFAMTTSFGLNYSEETGIPLPDGEVKDLITEQISGFVGDATAYPRCRTIDFITSRSAQSTENNCPDNTAIGMTGAALRYPYLWFGVPVYNLTPPPGVAVQLGFSILMVNVVINVGVKQSPDHNIVANLPKVAQALTVFGGKLQVWGNPASPAHDRFRGRCYEDQSGGVVVAEGDEFEFEPSANACSVNTPQRAFITLPGSCSGPAMTSWEADSWQEPGKWVFGSTLSHDDSIPPNPQGLTGCNKLGFSPGMSAKATTASAETSTGLDFSIDFDDEGLKSPDGLAQSTIKKTVVTLPEGVTVNPSIGEGLGVCTPADLARETISSAPGAGCPNPSKIGTVNVDTPLVDQPIKGDVYLAQQDDPGTSAPRAENPFDSLLAFYIVLRNKDLGVLVKLPAKVEPDPKTGQLVTTVDDIPQFPFSHFDFHFREGQRAPLVSPSACGTYTTKAELTPWSNPAAPRPVISTFQITSGIGGAVCPSGGVPPFTPDFQAGALNNNAGSFSPFNMRLLRGDGEQDMTKFSSILPPGELGSLKGVDKCPDAAIAIAKAKTGRQELASPSCPANSLIGHTLAGAGVGEALTYVGGQIYLAGPYKGDPLSVISVTPAVAGPFDAGTVVVRLALTLNPKTAEVEVDGAASDPIPHILKGIVLKVRDLRVYVDRPNFTLNPTSCEESSTKATLFGSYLNVFDPSDDVPVALKSRYQAASCASLGFKPRLALNLKGGTKRGGHPGLLATYTPRSGDANVKGLVVRLPRSAFLDQAHIRTICTRVQFAADACPKGAQYGYIKAWTPLLEEPLQGPVWLRSSNHKLPDLVFDLHGLVDVEVATRIDSVKGGIRARVEEAPDAPLSKVELKMQGANKGLIVNSRNLCGPPSKASVEFSGHNGKRFTSKPVMRPDCGRKGKRR
ncbi:MAG: hypothetical protein ABW196_06895 [Solirubrobacterales bacterium]